MAKTKKISRKYRAKQQRSSLDIENGKFLRKTIYSILYGMIIAIIFLLLLIKIF